MRRRFIVFVVPVMALVLSVTGVSAHVSGNTLTSALYVSTHGSDANPCTQALPCATMQHAVNIALPGFVIHVEAGTYNQTVNITKPLTLAGAGRSKTIVNGSNIDTETFSPAYFGVVSVQTNTGTGGAIRIRGMTIKGAYVTPTEYADSAPPVDVSIYSDANAGDTVTISGVTLGAVQDTADYGGYGLDTFNNKASVTFTNSLSTGNNTGALLEGGGIGGEVTVSHVTFAHLVDCAGSCSGSSTVYPADGVFVLSDQPGTAVDTINGNTFHDYAGFGVAVAAGYSGGNCSGANGPCTGNVSLTANSNAFALGACASASDYCAAIFLDAETGNELSAQIRGNSGTVVRPDKAIYEYPGGGVYNVTEINNHIKVLA